MNLPSLAVLGLFRFLRVTQEHDLSWFALATAPREQPHRPGEATPDRRPRVHSARGEHACPLRCWQCCRCTGPHPDRRRDHGLRGDSGLCAANKLVVD